jgi:hypothetical protein
VRLLTQAQREKSLTLLAKAPDEILLSAIVDLRKHWHLHQGTLANYEVVMKELEGAEHAANSLAAQAANHLAANAQAATAPEPKPTPGPEPEPLEERVNQSPGMPSVRRINSNTYQEIMDALKAGHSVKLKHVDACKLLWARGEIKYDGQGFYL